MFTRILFTCLVALCAAFSQIASAQSQLTQSLTTSELPATPFAAERSYAAKSGDSLLAIESGSGKVYTLDLLAPESWQERATLDGIPNQAASTGYENTLLIIGGTTGTGEATADVTEVAIVDGDVKQISLSPLPEPLASPATAVWGTTLYVAGVDADDQRTLVFSLDLDNANGDWTEVPSPSFRPRQGGFLIKSVETLSYLGGSCSDGVTDFPSLTYDRRYGWAESKNSTPPGVVRNAAKLGDAHAVAAVERTDGLIDAYLYHMVGDTWVTLQDDLLNLPSDTQVISDGSQIYLISQERSVTAAFNEPETNYGWFDHISVAAYFLVMIYVGFHFAKQSKNSEDYFRGGHRIPWWATGMSLFATGASAMSLMAMPGKSYAGNWTFFAISIYSVMCLPIALYFFAPVIRKLNFGTAFEYLENRFGLSVRLIGSSIFAVYQVLGRMGGVLLLPSFALEAIAGIPMSVSVPIMGLVTIAYTFLGGLSAVIWTDTIQGLVMVSAVGGCLLLVLFRIDVPFSEMWTTLQTQDKLHVFDWGFSLTEENVFTVFIGIVCVTLLGIGDQNFVQRVQCSDSLNSTRKAIVTQMAVAVPINLLLFGLGTALFLFYKHSPEALNPVMRNDGIYPFFAAQQLPPGVSGLVIAALLAATMSTISSSICSVSNLAVDDVYKRFSRNPTERGAVLVGRIITVIVGLFGIASAFYLDSFETPSIWDLALRVVSIVTATTVGIYFLGLFTRKSNEIGVLVGIVAGMASTYYISKEEIIIFWLYPVVGSTITVLIGYAVSLATGGNKKDITGLTMHTINQRTGGLDD